MGRTTRRSIVSIALLGVLLAGGVASNAPVAAATPHRAAVIVDTGNGVHRVVITFTEDSITGIEALRRAGADPVVYTFGGQGGAVCRVFGVGRDAGPSCLGGQDGDNRYWAYFRAPAGSSSFTYSSVGAGTAKVHDGDVEGWRFGLGTAPEFVTLQSLLPPPPPPGPAGTTATTPGATGSTPGADDGPPRSGSVAAGGRVAADPATSRSTLPVVGGEGSTGGNGSSGAGSEGARATSDGARGSGDGPDGRREAAETALAASTTDDGSSASSLVWFGVLLAVIVIAIVVVRRVRRRSPESTA